MIKDILLIISGLICAILFTYVRGKVINKTKEVVGEKWSTPKFLSGMTNIVNAKEWGKDISSIFNARKLIIYGIIIGVIFGYGYFKGKQGAPVHFDLRGKAATIRLNEHFLKIEPDGTAKVVDKEGRILKTIRVKDIPELERALRPFGFKLQPIAVAGGSLGASGAGFEAGLGVSWLKYYKWNLDSFLTNRGLYGLGASYQITDNSGVGLGAGIGFKGDKRVVLYYKWRF